MILRRDGYELSDDRNRIDIDLTWGFLRTSYWSANVPRDVVQRAIAGSLCLGLYGPDDKQAGFARAVTDFATYAWIADVFVLESHRGSGLGTWIVESLLCHPDMQGLRLTVLATRDAHSLYERFGFEAISDRLMAISNPAEALYGRPAEKLTE